MELLLQLSSVDTSPTFPPQKQVVIEFPTEKRQTVDCDRVAARYLSFI